MLEGGAVTKAPTVYGSPDLAKEKGGSSWREALPIQEHQFNLSRKEFRDCLCLRYGWTPDRLPSACVCGSAFDVDHAMSCPTGGLRSIRHNEMRDLLALTMSEVYFDVQQSPIWNQAIIRLRMKATEWTL